MGRTARKSPANPVSCLPRPPPIVAQNLPRLPCPYFSATEETSALKPLWRACASSGRKDGLSGKNSTLRQVGAPHSTVSSKNS